jgi:hypothetical protein
MCGLFAALALVLEVLVVSTPAFAHPVESLHDGVGVLVVEGRHPVGPSDIHYVVSLTWSVDSHIADTATVIATVVGAESTTPPVALQFDPVSGRYMGTVHFPWQGLWMVRFDTANPVASVDSLELVPPLLAAPPAGAV